MTLVKRWFLETEEGEILDGPFKNEASCDRELAVHVRLYKYVPIKIEREMELVEHATTEKKPY